MASDRAFWDLTNRLFRNDRVPDTNMIARLKANGYNSCDIGHDLGVLETFCDALHRQCEPGIGTVERTRAWESTFVRTLSQYEDPTEEHVGSEYVEHLLRKYAHLHYITLVTNKYFPVCRIDVSDVLVRPLKRFDLYDAIRFCKEYQFQ